RVAQRSEATWVLCSAFVDGRAVGLRSAFGRSGRRVDELFLGTEHRVEQGLAGRLAEDQHEAAGQQTHGKQVAERMTLLLRFTNPLGGVTEGLRRVPEFL